MPKSKKRKASPQLLKQQEAENKKRFYQKVNVLFSKLGQPDLFSLLSRETLEKLYRIKVSPPILEFDSNIDITPSNINKLREVIYNNLKFFPVTINNCAIDINCYEYLTTWLSIYGFLTGNSFKQIPEEKLIYDRIGQQVLDIVTTEKIADIVSLIDISLSLGLSKLNSSFYSLTHDWNIVNNNHVATIFRFHEIKSPKVEIVIDGLVRPVYQVGWVLRGQFIPMSIDRRSLRIDPRRYPKMIDVYIQNHALHRICERIDNISESELHFHLLGSFSEIGKIIRRSNKYLIEYKFLNTYKIGYLVATLIGDKLIVKTFLLLTQEGTPEEHRLKQLTGLSRHDIHFLKLDKFSSFFDKTLYSDTKMKALLEEAGFKPILDCVSNYNWATDQKTSLAEKLRKYLIPEDDKPNWHEVAETIKEEELA